MYKFILLAIVGFFGWAYFADYNDTKSNSTTASAEAFNAPELQRPVTGSVWAYVDAVNTSSVAPFQIQTSGESDYYVKLVFASSGANIMGIFVRGGETVEVKVPLGNYKVKYASGKSWFGTGHLFGPDTSYSKADTTFDFKSDGNQISGYTITLYQVSNGNLRTTSLEASQF